MSRDKNYTIYHLHSDISNATTNIDSVTKYNQYIDRAKECGMKALGFSEHGNIFMWFKKKTAIEAADMKYLHGIEAYITMQLSEKIRDNYHCILIARNYDGFKEINKLFSSSYKRIDDNHFYYTPRISMDELENTSDNIIITTACLGSALHSENEDDKKRFLEFCFKNKHRVFLEIQHHLDVPQIEHNRWLYKLSQQYGFRLIAGTDTHSLNETHAKGRMMLQKGKNVHFDNEDTWDLTFKTYDELCAAYRRQKSLSEDVYLEAIENTNVLADMVESFDLDYSNKYPNVFENPDAEFRKIVYDSIYKHPYALKNHSEEELKNRVDEELSVYESTGSTPYMLLKYYLTQWEHDNGIYIGYGRGSVNGSMIAYLLGITDMDSMRFGLNFFRFMNPARVSLPDIDSDYGAEDRDKVKKYLLQEHMGYPQMQTAEIITFNTIATKGAIRDIGRGMSLDLATVNEYCRQVNDDGSISDSLRSVNPQLFEYVDIVSGTIVSVGSHPCGVLVSDRDIAEEIGLCTTSGSDYPVTALYMKELDALNYIKWDILGLDNVALINGTCKMLGIDRLTPDNVNLEDEKVWQSIRDDTTLIFQWESEMSSAYIRRFMSDLTLRRAKDRDSNFSMINWMSFGNALLRPACASYRDDVAEGESYDNGLDELNEFLFAEAGHLCMQETIMQFLVKFCGYTPAESDSVRRAIAKKTGTEQLLPEIEKRFVEYTNEHYNVPIEQCNQTIKPFLQVILDASEYSFSKNHSYPYSCIGYICGYLRYYYPVEFIATALNVFSSDINKTAAIMEYAHKNKIKVNPPKFGYSAARYRVDKDTNEIYKGIASIKFMNEQISDSLFELSQSKKFDCFMDVLKAVKQTGINSRQLTILIQLDYFSQFGNARELEAVYKWYDYFKQGDIRKIKKDKITDDRERELISKHSTDVNAKGDILKSYTITDADSLLYDAEKLVKSLNLADYSMREKINQQIETMGYFDIITGKEEDRSRLYISEFYTLRSKDDGKPWGYAITARSIGSGRTTRYTVKKFVYDNEPFAQGDIIRVFPKSHGGWHRTEKGYYYIDSYEIEF